VFAQKQFGIVRRGRVNCKVIKRKVIREGKKNDDHRARTILRAAVVFLKQLASRPIAFRYQMLNFAFNSDIILASSQLRIPNERKPRPKKKRYCFSELGYRRFWGEMINDKR